MKQRPGAVVLLSGGQDSATCLFYALRHFGQPVTALSIAYGQRHAAELKAAKRIARLAKVDHVMFRLGPMRDLAPSALTGGEAKQHGELPATFVPGRNAVFLSLAAGLAATRGVDRVVGGMCQTDYAGYPDCRADFATAMDRALRLAIDSPRLAVVTPLMFATKADTVRMARDLGGECWEALRLTVSCYEGKSPPGCGTCSACALRARGFKDAGIPDPAVGA